MAKFFWSIGNDIKQFPLFKGQINQNLDIFFIWVLDVFIKYKVNIILKFQMNWVKHFGDIGRLELFIFHTCNQIVVGRNVK